MNPHKTLALYASVTAMTAVCSEKSERRGNGLVAPAGPVAPTIGHPL